MTTETEHDLTDTPDLWLVQSAYEYREAGRRMFAEADRLDYEIIRRAQANGATGLPVTGYDVVVKESSATYDPARLTPLLEMLPNLEGWTKGHEEKHWVDEPPDTWDLRQTLPAARRVGTRAMDVIADARIPGRLSVKITARG